MTEEQAIAVAKEHYASRGIEFEYLNVSATFFTQEYLITRFKTAFPDVSDDEIRKKDGEYSWARLESHWRVKFELMFFGRLDACFVKVYLDGSAAPFPTL
jgi:hypothetical protein